MEKRSFEVRVSSGLLYTFGGLAEHHLMRLLSNLLLPTLGADRARRDVAQRSPTRDTGIHKPGMYLKIQRHYTGALLGSGEFSSANLPRNAVVPSLDISRSPPGFANGIHQWSHY